MKPTHTHTKAKKEGGREKEVEGGRENDNKGLGLSGRVSDTDFLFPVTQVHSRSSRS